jgi:hypothetical protein
MKRKTDRHRKITELIERVGRDEEIKLRSDDDQALFVWLEGIIDDWRAGLPLRECDRDLLMEVVIPDFILPVRRGGPPKSQQAKADEAAALAVGRRYYRDVKKEKGLEAKVAWETTVRKLKEWYPTIFDKLENATINYRLRRKIGKV